MEQDLLVIKDLCTQFKTDRGVFPAVSGLDITIRKGEILCIVGESGSGKTVASLSLMQLLPSSGSIASGQIRFEGTDLLKLKKKEIGQIRGKSIAMIFQDPMVALDPVFTCGSQIVEAIRIHDKRSYAAARERTLELLKLVGIAHPERVFDAYPHELSGGMCQRIMIAMALSCNPKLLIADEPTTALDVTVQAQILELLKRIRDELGMSIMLITHDLGVVAEMADRVAVMYAGKIMEVGDARTVFKQPQHPYTQGLLKSIPHLDREGERLYSISGSVPSISAMPEGCRFAPRCPHAAELCRRREPQMIAGDGGCFVRCWMLDQAWEEEEAG
ncbi:oligopeptide/dipeptide ABC transporter, ATP-binding protein, C-terminal domain-containing protein [Paenibacillus sp. UNCCL117]|uniref:ABC transporter ATP-binding protein n=1 Tax=unclassified Paenibacillus TaxID=185978 RepID=UPI00088A9E5B|nr:MULTISPECIES: ABC transporter ATP-binding protein [unclassified Paenibacillus]SDD06092.1 oligopeptide/dipeptide ABC transporter, ATP-binding protein, C-terminal domain-containing protein [Paenibacillus sp. cl123]SFW31764.1 oligopeptide/dipeptide ABC transporter, ATP-binding protein, C-terminal domain-containing protein [Paenibacillus sp. UNCCL117]